MREIDRDIMVSCYKEKARLIEAVGEAYSTCSDLQVSGARYEAWLHTKTGCVQEWMVLVHWGGAIKVRTVNMNSNSVNMKELGMLAYNSYYDEVESYREFVKAAKDDDQWERLI